MKQLFILLMPLLLLAGCQPNDPAGEQNTAEATQQAAVEVPAGSGSVATPVVPDLTIEEANLLIKDYWVAEYWVDHKSKENSRLNKGRWWQFFGDGTYRTGHWEEELAQGSWSIYRDQAKLLVHLDANDDRLDEQFEIQGVTIAGGYMSWVGTELYNMNNIAVKAITLLSVPTKKQFGVAE